MPSADAALTTPAVLHGGCFCGAVRYAARSVFDAGWCHCTVCRRIGGSAAACWFSVREADFAVTAGDPAALRSSTHFTRFFCARCGTHLFGRDDLPAPPRVGSRLVSAMLGTLDDPAALAPRVHQWWAERMPWFSCAGDGLPRFDTGRISHPDDRHADEPPAGGEAAPT